ncbi:MAG: efflux RND transporter periplasmic adaptor subunit [Lentisphaerae bacterium]|nr:efflux RND transporter periplasmic adaptor subunit [Lentisphaerota bacterium]
MCKNKINSIVISCIVALAVFPAGCGRRGAVPAMPPPEVSIITVKTEKIVLTTELPGRTTAYLVAEVRPQVGGIVQKRLFEEGTEVKEGDILYQIDPSLYQATYDRAKAELGKAEAKIIPLKNKYERHKVLIESKAISQQDFDNTVSDFNTGVAEIQVCKAAVDTARINLEYTKVVAPISGRIGKSHVTVGALVTANHLFPLSTIQQLDPIYVDVTQSSANFLRLKRSVLQGLVKSNNVKGAKVKLSYEDGSPYPLDGEMQFSDVSVDQSTGSYTLRIVFPNPDSALLPGMYVRAMVEEGIIEDAILVPHQAVTRNMRGEPAVFIADSADKVEIRKLSVDRSIGDNWLIKEGLRPGDRVIIEGVQMIRPGVQVKVIPFGAQATPSATQPVKK